MTSLVNNFTIVTCPICWVDYQEGEKEDTDKVIKLACYHFQQRDCIGSWPPIGT